jgi:hypothetical protein
LETGIENYNRDRLKLFMVHQTGKLDELNGATNGLTSAWYKLKVPAKFALNTKRASKMQFSLNI